MSDITIYCVTMATLHLYSDNLITDQYQLRYKEIVAKEQWTDLYVQPPPSVMPKGQGKQVCGLLTTPAPKAISSASRSTQAMLSLWSKVINRALVKCCKALILSVI